MSHHIVTVCMFCLLCAAHTCGSHIDLKDGVASYEPQLKELDHMSVIEDKRKHDPRARYHQKLQKIRHKDRTKRETKEIPNFNTNDFVEKIFMLYGDPESKTMNLTGFNKMLDGLNLHTLIEGGREEKTEVTWLQGAPVNEEVVEVSWLLKR